MILVLGFTVAEDGKPVNISILSPVGMGLDDDADKALMEWTFSPGRRDCNACPVHARLVFEINALIREPPLTESIPTRRVDGIPSVRALPIEPG